MSDPKRMAIPLGELVDRLSIVNIKISLLEADIRAGVLTDEAEIGRRAQTIRDLNGERVDLRNSLNAIERALGLGPGHVDVKVRHRSES